MFYGQLEDGENVFASERLIGVKVFCPICQNQLRIKRSSRGRYFFVHYQKCQKDYGEGSKHRFWKNYIMNYLSDREAKEEVVFSNRRRGDIYIEIENSVIEIQFSSIRASELARRIEDYQILNLKQFWLFQWPNITKGILTLTPMTLHLWCATDLPLIYINDKEKCLYVITQLQFISNRRAFFNYRVYCFGEMLKIQRDEFKKEIAQKLQRKWLEYYRKEFHFLSETNKRYRTRLAQKIYYLSSKTILENEVGRAYTGNVFFITSPVVWQVDCLYLYLICQKPVEECARILQKQMIKTAPPAELIVKQLLEQFLVELPHSQ